MAATLPCAVRTFLQRALSGLAPAAVWLASRPRLWMSPGDDEVLPAGDHFCAMRHRRNRSSARSEPEPPECGFRQPKPRSRVLIRSLAPRRASALRTQVDLMRACRSWCAGCLKCPIPRSKPGDLTMKNALTIVAAVAAAMFAQGAFAQASAPTRAEVKAETKAAAKTPAGEATMAPAPGTKSE